MDVYQLLYSSIPGPFFYHFRGCVCTDFRVYSGVGVLSGSTTYKVQPRFHEGVRQTWRALQLIARLCETCTGRQRLSLASALLLPDQTRETVLLEFPSSRNRFPLIPPFPSCPKTVFPRFPLSLNHALTRHLLRYQCSIRGCSKQILGDFTLRIPTAWEGKIHGAHVKA